MHFYSVVIFCKLLFFNVRCLSGRPAMTKDSVYLKRNTDMTRAVI